MKTGFHKIVDRAKRVSAVTIVATFLLVIGVAIALATSHPPHPPDWADPIPDARTYGVAADSNGNVYAAGEDTVNDRFMVSKYDSTGTLQWRTTETVGWASAIAVDSDDNVIATGGDSGVFRTVKYDTDGNELWSKDSTVAYVTWGSLRIAVDGHNNVYVVGGASLATEGGLLTIKYDERGKEKWAVHYPARDGRNFKFALDDNEDVYIATTRDGTVKYRGNNGQELWVREAPDSGYEVGIGVKGDYVYTAYHADNDGQVLTKYDLDGNKSWATTYTVPDTGVWPTDLGIDDNDNVYTAAYTYQGPSYLTVKHEPTSGTVEWAKTYKGPSGEGEFWAWYIAVDGSGNSYVNGEGTEPTSTTGTDIWTVKYDTSGTILWQDGYDDGASGGEWNYDGAIALDSNGVYIAGERGGSRSTGPVLKYTLD